MLGPEVARIGVGLKGDGPELSGITEARLSANPSPTAGEDIRYIRTPLEDLEVNLSFGFRLPLRPITVGKYTRIQMVDKVFRVKSNFTLQE